MGDMYLVNLDKKEYVDPLIGEFAEIIVAPSVPGAILIWLLAKEAFGEEECDYPTFGKWAGDRVVVLDGELMADMEEEGIKFKDISEEVLADIKSYLESTDAKRFYVYRKIKKLYEETKRFNEAWRRANEGIEE